MIFKLPFQGESDRDFKIELYTNSLGKLEGIPLKYWQDNFEKEPHWKRHLYHRHQTQQSQ